MQIREPKSKLRLAEIDRFFQSVGIPQPISSVVAGLLTPADYINAHLNNRKAIATYCLFLLEENEPNDIAFALNELTPLEKNALLDYFRENDLLLWAYFSNHETWTSEQRQAIDMTLGKNKNIPSSLFHAVKIKYLLLENNQFFDAKKLLIKSIPNLNLMQAKFPKGESVSDVIFSSVNLREASFASMDSIIDVRFPRSDLTDVDFRGVKLIDVDFKEAKLNGANFNNITLDDTTKKSLIEYVLTLKLLPEDPCSSLLDHVKNKNGNDLICGCIDLIWLLGAKNEVEYQTRLRHDCPSLSIGYQLLR